MIYGVLLAAGLSTRMGQPKQLLIWQGQPLVRHIAQQALASKLDGLVVVVGAEAATTRAALVGLGGPLQTIENSSYLSGQASTLRVGLGALPSAAQAAVILLVDQPLITPVLIDELIDAYQEGDALAVIPRYADRRGNPVLLARPLFDEVKALTGDVGARVVIQRYPEAVRWLDVDDPAVVTDMDTPEAYEAAKRKI
jgi:molybdenum cofactor cytidylyltransferase